MLRLTFHVPASRELVVNLEAREGFKIIGPLLLRCPESEVVARYVQPYWQIDERNATHFECAQQSFVRFSDGDEATPPFRPVQSPALREKLLLRGPDSNRRDRDRDRTLATLRDRSAIPQHLRP